MKIFLIRDSNKNLETLFDNNKNQLLDWCRKIYIPPYLENKVYIENETDNKVIYSLDLDEINKENIYFLIQKIDNGLFEKFAIFDLKTKNFSQWFDLIFMFGLVNGESNYYIAEINDQQAIFDQEHNQISDWFNFIPRRGLILGFSIYYIVREGNKYTIFDKDKNQIISWLNEKEFKKQIGFEYLDKTYSIIDLLSKENIIEKRLFIKEIIKKPNEFEEIIKFFLDCYKKGYILHTLEGYKDILKIKSFTEKLFNIIGSNPQDKDKRKKLL